MYSQSSEERYILEYFEKASSGATPPRWVVQGYNRPRVLDLGANDGVTFSNSRALILSGSKAVLVEPSPKAFDRLKTLYDGHKGIYVYPYALAGHNGKAILNESSALCTPQDVGLVSTFHSHEMERFKRSVKYEPIEVKCFRWKTFLNRLPIKEFDFVSIDCEGSDLEILAQMDLSKVQCICLEWNGNLELKKDFEYYLEGFKLLYTSGENVLYGR